MKSIRVRNPEQLLPPLIETTWREGRASWRVTAAPHLGRLVVSRTQGGETRVFSTADGPAPAGDGPRVPSETTTERDAQLRHALLRELALRDVEPAFADQVLAGRWGGHVVSEGETLELHLERATPRATLHLVGTAAGWSATVEGPDGKKVLRAGSSPRLAAAVSAALSSWLLPFHRAAAETKPKPKAETKPKPKAETKPKPKAETKPKPKAETKPKPKAETKPKPKAETKPKPKAETKPKPKAETKPKPKAEPSRSAAT